MMSTQDPKEAPIGSDSTGVGTPQQKYFTADEAKAFLEPRIRAMFKWNVFFEELENVYSIVYLANNQLIGHHLDINLQPIASPPA